MVTEAELLVAVEAAFATTARGLAGWPDPHPDRVVADEEYSRVTDPAKWRILGARVDAWLVALVEAGLAGVERDVADSRWRPPFGGTLTSVDRVVPTVEGGLVLVVGRSQIAEVDDAGIVLGVGDPPVDVAMFPDCGCDACDSGSEDELNEVDRHLRSIVTGRFRRLWMGAYRITVVGDQCSTTNLPRRADVDAILADPQGWKERSGPSWLSAG